MKYIRLYENDNVEFGVGDYVLINTRTADIAARYNDEYLEFISGCIGRIIEFSYNEVEVEFDKIWVPPSYFNVIREPSTINDSETFKFDDIEFWSDNYEDIKYRFDVKKYNL